MRPEVLSFSTPARGERRPAYRGAIRRIRVILTHPFTLRLWGRPSQVVREQP